MPRGETSPITSRDATHGRSAQDLYTDAHTAFGHHIQLLLATGHGDSIRQDCTAAAAHRFGAEIDHSAERTRTLIRPLDEDEAVALRHAAEYVTRPSRHAAAAALALSGGHTGEIGHIRILDLDKSTAAVWIHGSTRTDPRWCPLDPWALRVLLARAAFVARQQRIPEAAAQARLAVSSAPAPDEQLQARACVALSDLIRRIGLGADPRVKPASLTAHAAVRIFDGSGKIEDVARGLGLRSLDRAADLVGYDWTRPTAEGQAASA
jgi:integrase